MNQTQAKELLPVFAAYAEGKTVQWASQSAEDWTDYTNGHAHWQEPCIFLNLRFRWRVKPEPREWWVCPKSGTAYNDNPFGWQPYRDPKSEVVHVREVLK